MFLLVFLLVFVYSFNSSFFSLSFSYLTMGKHQVKLNENKKCWQLPRIKKMADEVMADENSALHHRNKLYFIIYSNSKTVILNCNKYLTILLFLLDFSTNKSSLDKHKRLQKKKKPL